MAQRASTANAGNRKASNSNSSGSTTVGSTQSRNMSRSGDRTTSDSDNNESYASTYQLVARPTPVWVLNRQGQAVSSQTVPGTTAPYHEKQVSLGGYEYPDESNIGMGTHEKLAIDKSRWNSFIVSTSRPVVGLHQAYIDERALEEQEDLNSAWVGTKDSDGILHSSNAKKLKRAKEKGRAGGYALGPTRYLVSEDSRKVLKTRINVILLNNPFVPLTLRLIIFILSVVALGLACSIFVHSRQASPSPVPQMASTTMAVCVQCCALVYLVYITYDEYSGKPIGLREPKAKMRLIMLDLLFIIFSSANLSLTFNTLYDRTWVCLDDKGDSRSIPKNYPICSRQRGLASFLFLVLVMWVSTFTISIFRLVERVSK